jgi:hypothetical protein
LHQPTDARSVEAAGERYFCSYKLDWAGVWDHLQAMRAIQADNSGYRLMGSWLELAQARRARRPRFPY